MRRQIEEWAAELRERWAHRKARIDGMGLQALERAQRLEQHERLRVRELAGHKSRVERHLVRQQEAERRGESDEEVVRDLERFHPELVPIFMKLRRGIRAPAHISRPEAMLHWAHDNPDEVMALRAADQQAELERAIREHQEAEREVARHQRVRKVRAATRGLAAAVPF